MRTNSNWVSCCWLIHLWVCFHSTTVCLNISVIHQYFLLSVEKQFWKIIIWLSFSKCCSLPSMTHLFCHWKNGMNLFHIQSWLDLNTLQSVSDISRNTELSESTKEFLHSLTKAIWIELIIWIEKEFFYHNMWFKCNAKNVLNKLCVFNQISSTAVSRYFFNTLSFRRNSFSVISKYNIFLQIRSHYY